MLRVDLRNDHRNIRSPSMSAVVRNYRCLSLGIFLFNMLDLILRHVNCRKDKIYIFRNALYICDIFYNEVLYRLRNWVIHFPSLAYCFLIGLSGRTWACCNCSYFKPRMIIDNINKSLSNHSCSTKNCYFQLVTHNKNSSLILYTPFFMKRRI